MEQSRSVAVTPKGAVAIIAHDAGGAEILSSWACKHMLKGVAVLGGPATKIFNVKIPDIVRLELVDAIRQCDWLLIGTGNSDFEYDAIVEARKTDVYIVAFLDHWTAYEKRFTRAGNIFLPDEIWVGDPEALQLVRRLFPDLISTYIPNPYWEDALARFNDLDTVCEEEALLFMSSNIDDHYLTKPDRFSDHWLLTQIINYFKKSKTLPEINSVTVRKHPSESESKYANFCYPGVDIHHDLGCDLMESIARHRFIAGQNSMGQVIGKLCGRRTINFLIDSYSDEQIPRRYVDEVVYLSSSRL